MRITRRELTWSGIASASSLVVILGSWWIGFLPTFESTGPQQFKLLVENIHSSHSRPCDSVAADPSSKNGLGGVFSPCDSNPELCWWRQGPGEIAFLPAVTYRVIQNESAIFTADIPFPGADGLGRVIEPSLAIQRWFTGSRWELYGEAYYDFRIGNGRNINLTIAFANTCCDVPRVGIGRHSDLKDHGFEVFTGNLTAPLGRPLKWEELCGQALCGPVPHQKDHYEFRICRWDDKVEARVRHKEPPNSPWASQIWSLPSPGEVAQVLHLSGGAFGDAGKPVAFGEFSELRMRGANLKFEQPQETALHVISHRCGPGDGPISGDQISADSSQGDVVIQDCKITGPVVWKDDVRGAVIIKNAQLQDGMGCVPGATFHRPVAMVNAWVQKELRCIGATFEGGLTLYAGTKVNGPVLLRESTFHKTLALNGVTARYIDVSTGTRFRDCMNAVACIAITNPRLARGITLLGAQIQGNVVISRTLEADIGNESQVLELGESLDLTGVTAEGELVLGSGGPPKDCKAVSLGQEGAQWIPVKSIISLRGEEFKGIQFHNVRFEREVDFTGTKVSKHLQLCPVRFERHPLSLGELLAGLTFASKDVWAHLAVLGKEGNDQWLARVASYKGAADDAGWSGRLLSSLYSITSVYGLRPLRWLSIGLGFYVLCVIVMYGIWRGRRPDAFVAPVSPKRAFGIQLDALPTVRVTNEPGGWESIQLGDCHWSRVLGVLAIFGATIFWKVGFDKYRLDSSLTANRSLNRMAWATWTLGTIWYIYAVLLIGIQEPPGF